MTRLYATPLLFGIACVLAGCTPKSTLDAAAIPEDYRARHPIVLAEKPVSADVFLAGGKLDHDSRGRIRAIGTEYARSGSGPIALQLPEHIAQDPQVSMILDGVRHELSAGGARGSLAISSYRATHPNIASPIRLTYRSMGASLQSPCGQWPSDLGSASGMAGRQNRPYWNHGCAYQQMLASQVADPRDLAAPRAESPADVAMRSRAITKVREGVDPGTTWQTTITSVGGGQ